MPIPSQPLNLLAFPQAWDAGARRLSLRFLVLPKGDPEADFTPAFPDAALAFTARAVPSLDALPTLAASAVQPLALAADTVDPVERRRVFDAFVGTFDQPDGSGFQVGPAAGPVEQPRAVKKLLTASYQAANRAAAPRTRFAVGEEAYDCALRDGQTAPPTGVPPSRRFSWEEIWGFVLRQPLLAEKLGLLYRAEVPLDPNPFEQGGYLFVDLAAGSDLAAKPRQLFAARIPPLGQDDRALFAAVLFPVDHADNFDAVFAEAELYDDGYAKLVHGVQPPRAALLEGSQSPLPAPKDVGIRLGWDDEQVAIWLNRQLGINAVDPFLPAPPAPSGIGGYRVDVFDEEAGAWRSLMAVAGDLELAGLPLGRFEGELAVEALPVNLENDPNGEFWLPSYFAAWAGGSMALPDRTPFALAGQPDLPGPAIYQPVGADEVPLRYSNTYRFRVRLMDLTGGGPAVEPPPAHLSPAAVAEVPFRRFVAPKRPEVTGGLAAGGRTATYEIRRPEIAWPDVLFTGRYDDPLALLLPGVAAAAADGREPGLPDPDATLLRIEVQVRTLAGDPAASAATGQPFRPLYTTVRPFPTTPDRPLPLTFELADRAHLTALENAVLPEDGPLPLPTARALRVVFTPLGFEDPHLDYWGSPEARQGAAPVAVYLFAPSAAEPALFLPPAEAEIQGIFLQPDVSPGMPAIPLPPPAPGERRREPPGDLAERLAHHLDLPLAGLTFSSHPGRRTVYGASAALRHTLAPDAAAITWSTKSDLERHWIVPIRLTLDRDWTWYAPGPIAGGALPFAGVFTVERSVQGGPFTAVGRLTLPGVVNPLAARNPQREATDLVFFDAYDPKPAPGQPLVEPVLSYRVVPAFDGVALPDPLPAWTLRLPLTTPPGQVPKLVSAGFALSDYEHDDRYSQTEPRRRQLFVELDAPPADPADRYFARVLAYGPDPLLLERGLELPSPPEPELPIEPEPLRAVIPEQPNDRAGLSAMQELIPATDRPDNRHFLLPLPPGLSEEDPALFGFFVYELRVGHDASRWCTAQGRFGHPLRATGVQHPAPPLATAVMRTLDQVVATAPFATPVIDGRNARPFPPNSRLEGLLYAQVCQADGAAWRNVLLLRSPGQVFFPQQNFRIADPRLAPGRIQFPQDDIVRRLNLLGLPVDSPLSVLAVELLPEPGGQIEDPLGHDLGKVRILRASPLTPVPEICPPME